MDMFYVLMISAAASAIVLVHGILQYFCTWKPSFNPADECCLEAREIIMLYGGIIRYRGLMVRNITFGLLAFPITLGLLLR